MPSDATSRFSDRVRDYVRYRPSYPPAAIAVLRAEGGLQPGAVVADLGSGTGILTKLLLDTGATVFAVEPNEPMRVAAEEYLRGYPAFRSVNGTAEATSLPDRCADLITAAQAFHWFDIPKARTESRRILKSGGAVVLLWNERLLKGDEFLEEYEALIRRHATDYEKVNHLNVSASAFDAFFGAGNWKQTLVPNEQVLDYPGLAGRLLSSSYVPAAGKPGNAGMMKDLETLFIRHQSAGQVVIKYEVKIVSGRLG